MKTRLIVVLLGFLGSGMFVACRDDASDKDDDRPGKAVELAFQAKYPGATGVEWESKGVFREADFTLNGREYEAWFNTSGIWLQAEYAVTYTSVPAAIKDFIANSIDYPPTLWTPDAATEVLERKNYPDWYAVELENGANEDGSEKKEWTSFMIPFKYLEGKSYEQGKEYMMAIVCSSSKDGDKFKGAVNSTLIVDELEIVGE